jgi:ATP-dependent Zn protease
VSTEADSSGFVYSKFSWNYIARQDINKRVAMYLGGFVAEELVFGSEHVTAGSSSDIISATKFLSRMFKSEGFGDLPLYYNLDLSDNDSIHNIENIELQIQETIKKGYNLAKEILKKEMQVLLILSNYLSDHSFIEKEALKQLIQNHKVSEVEFIDNNDDIYYRRHLKNALSNKENRTSVAFEGLCLNRDNKNQ